MPLKPYEEFAQEPLGFPVGGKVYTVPPLGYLDGIRLQRILAGDDDSMDEAPAEEAWKLVLGGVFDEMVADKVPGDAVARAGFAAITDFKFGRAAAERVWESGIDPKALAQAVEQATGHSPGSGLSRNTGGERRTRKRASTSGTNSPKTTKRGVPKGSLSSS